MCESTVYTMENKLLMEDVMVVEIYGDKIDMIDILNNKKHIRTNRRYKLI